MSTKPITVVFFALLLTGQSLLRGQDMDTEISNLGTNLATAIKEQQKKKVAVIDFTDLQGGSSELGKYVAEQLTVDLVMVRQDFSVLDRANLRKILAEHKLTATGLVDPDNAKKLGQFAGVDAIILGTVTPKKLSVAVTAKIIATDTAEIVGAAKTQFKTDDTVEQLASKQTTESDPSSGDSGHDEKPKISKTLGDFSVELQSLRIVNGMDYLLSLNVTNVNPKKTIYVALECEGPIPGALKSTVLDPEGFQFTSYGQQVTGLCVGCSTFMGWGGAIKKILPHDSVPTTIKFASQPQRAASAGKCHIQLQFLDVTLDGYGRISNVTPRNLTFDSTAVGPGGTQ
jgi:TolB-like protein